MTEDEKKDKEDNEWTMMRVKKSLIERLRTYGYAGDTYHEVLIKLMDYKDKTSRDALVESAKETR